LALKAGDRETARVILEEEIRDENKDKVVRYLNDLGFSFARRRAQQRARPLKARPPTRPSRIMTKEISLKGRSLGQPLELVRRQREQEFGKVNVKEAVLTMLGVAEREILFASAEIDREITRILKEKERQGVDVKVLLPMQACKSLRRLGKATGRCIAKELATGIALRAAPFAVAALLPAEPAGIGALALLGVPVGLSLPALYVATAAALVYWNSALKYTFIPWFLKAAAVSSVVSLVSKLSGRGGSNIEVRVADAVPATLLVVDGRRGLSSECPPSVSSPCLARVYRDGAYELSREFSLLWEGARPA